MDSINGRKDNATHTHTSSLIQFTEIRNDKKKRAFEWFM